MKKTILASAILAMAVMVACKGSKSASSSTASTGVITPTNDQLTAVKDKYPGVTLEELNEGHKIYTGVCTNCHGAKPIYPIAEEKWPKIINSMSKKAKISDAEKEKLTRYVMSVKATQTAAK